MLTDFEYMQGLKLGSRMAALGETRRSLWPSRTTESGRELTPSLSGVKTDCTQAGSEAPPDI